MTVVCESCGSINLVRTKSSNLDKMVRWFSGRKRFSCNRCGWSALRAWHQPPSEAVRPALVKAEKKVQADVEDFDINQFH